MKKKLLALLVVALVLLCPSFSFASDVSDSIQALAKYYKVNPHYMLAIGFTESGLRKDAVGSYGERGPLQVLPSTFRALGGKRLYDWRETTAIGVKYFSQCLRAAKGDYRLAAIYYNAGIGNKNDRARRYASKVSRHYHRLREEREKALLAIPQQTTNWVMYSESFKYRNQSFD